MKFLGKRSVVSEPFPGFYPSPHLLRSGLRRCATMMSGLTLCAASSLALSLGLGDMQAKSYLGQPLNAEIELVSLDGSLDLSTLIVRQVSVAEAEAMGIDVSYTPYRFELSVNKSSGVPKISIISGQSIKEPYLNLLIELRWPAGTVYREYPILLDPPPAVMTAAVAPRQSTESQPRSAPIDRPPAPVQIELPPLRTSNGEYQVQAGDSLSKIAERWREGTSQGIDETMQWLHENNPNAFARGDINHLLAGATLRMPDLGAFEATDDTAPESIAVASDNATRQNINTTTVLPRIAGEGSVPLRTEVGNDAARSGQESGLLTLEASTRDDKTRELIDLLVRENESLKERVEKLESSEYLDTLKQLIILQRQEITTLRSELGVAETEAVAEMDKLLAQVGVGPSAATPADSGGRTQETDSKRVVADLYDQVESDEVASDMAESQALITIDGASQPPVQAQAEQQRGWFIAFMIGAVILLIGLFAAMYAYYRKLVPVNNIEEEYVETLEPLDEGEVDARASYAPGALDEADNFILYDAAPQPVYKPRKGQGNDDWMGDRVDLDHADLIAAIDKDIQKSFESLSLDEDALTGFGNITETSTEEVPDESAQRPKELSGPQDVKGRPESKNKSARRPDDEVKMSIAEKMSQYNPDEYRQELENLGFLELDELVDLNDSDEDEVEAIIYRAMMFCEFKKFDKAIDLIEGKMDVTADRRLNDALEKVRSLRGSSIGNKKVS